MKEWISLMTTQVRKICKASILKDFFLTENTASLAVKKKKKRVLPSSFQFLLVLLYQGSVRSEQTSQPRSVCRNSILVKERCRGFLLSSYATLRKTWLTEEAVISLDTSFSLMPLDFSCATGIIWSFWWAENNHRSTLLW